MFATLLAKENRLSLGICKFGSYSLSSPRHCHQSRWLQPIKTGKACSRKKGYQVDDSLANQTKNSLQEKKNTCCHSTRNRAGKGSRTAKKAKLAVGNKLQARQALRMNDREMKTEKILIEVKR